MVIPGLSRYPVSLITIILLLLKIMMMIIITIMIIIFYYYYYYDNDNNIFFMRVTQSNIGSDIRCGPQIQGLYLSCFRPQG